MQTSIDKWRDSRRQNVIKRAMIIQEMVSERYEPGNQRKCKTQAYRQHVNKVYPMSERTFWRYMTLDVEKELQEARHGQLVLEFS